ncbi:MAG: hypothetical protein AAGE03_04535 [Pseudomonadota bacterium]
MRLERADIERALAIAAQIVARDGEAFLPIFLRMEREVAALDGRDTALDRARRLVGGLAA